MKKTMCEMEQETGFSFYRGIGENFLTGGVSVEELSEKLRKEKYSEYWGLAYGLAVAFKLPVEDKSYEELLTSVQEFVNQQ